eukprot:TRINITY_DN15103_c0_g1_i1.p1 TRINITY_DN15103_c0_g1~~TRINITY_DN15103_c0_g1_i1.p1  ORF type:complete len:268 (+),score=59.44 TRINITY_DN15103_c0_g1_i1:71-874(+)
MSMLLPIHNMEVPFWLVEDSTPISEVGSPLQVGNHCMPDSGLPSCDSIGNDNNLLSPTTGKRQSGKMLLKRKVQQQRERLLPMCEEKPAAVRQDRYSQLAKQDDAAAQLATLQHQKAVTVESFGLSVSDATSVKKQNPSEDAITSKIFNQPFEQLQTERWNEVCEKAQLREQPPSQEVVPMPRRLLSHAQRMQTEICEQKQAAQTLNLCELLFATASPPVDVSPPQLAFGGRDAAFPALAKRDGLKCASLGPSMMRAAWAADIVVRL